MNFARLFTRFGSAIAVAGIALMSHAVSAQNAPSLAGTWKFLPDKSTFMPGPARFQNMTVAIPAAGDPVMTFDGTDAQGRPVKATLPAIPDGKPHPIAGMPGVDTGTWTRNSDTVTTYQYLKGKNIAVLGVRALSADGTTLTFNEKNYDANGRQIGTSVMVFQNPDVKVATVVKPAAPPPAPEAPRSALTPQEQEALAALSKNDADGAIRLFTSAIDAKTPMQYFDLTSRGIAYLQKGQEPQAMADFDAAVKLKPEDGEAHFRRGAIKFQHMQYEDAIDDLSYAIKANEMNADAYNMRSFAYYRLMKNTEGAADTDKACALKKDYCTN